MLPPACRLLLASLVCSAPALAGPPLVTDDPGLAGAGVLEAIAAAMVERRSDSESIEAMLDLTYGIRHDLDLLFVAGLAETRIDNGPSPESLLLAAGVKWQPWGGGERLLVSTAPAVRLDARDSGSRAFFFPIQLQGSAGRWQLGGEIGYTAARASPDSWQAGLYGARPLMSGSVMLLELWTTETPKIDQRVLGWSVGAEVQISDGLRLLISGGAGIDAANAERIDGRLYIGLQRIVSTR